MGSAPDGLLVSLLGPVEVSVGGRHAPITQQGLRVLLAVLAQSANRVVPAAALIEALWQEEPTRQRERNLHAQIYQLRRRLSELEPLRTNSRLVTREPGYLLQLAADELDLMLFTDLAARGRQSARAGDPAAAADLIGQALALWRGPALADVAELSDRLAADASALQEQHLLAAEDQADARLAAGLHADLTGELTSLVASHPLRERLRGQLMLALYRSGRQADALECYHEARRVLGEDLGIDPGPELQGLYQKILRGAASLAPPRLPAAAPGISEADADHDDTVPAAPALVPRQLPPAVRHFAGRDAELARLDALLEQAAPSGTVVITAIGGTGGVGKTALALHWAHKIADRFPDGQLHVNLRGYDPSGPPVTAAEAVRGFLDALAVPSSQIPQSPEAQAALYRTLSADRRMLILLDNARDPAQVRPLLPASPGCLVIVTSRSALTGLTTADGAVPVPLGLVSEAEAEAMLSTRLGRDRVAAEPAAVAQLIGLCARLPLALAIAAARAAANPAMSLTALGAAISGEQNRLDALDIDDPATSLRAVFSWSTSQLSDDSGRLFRLLGLHPGPDITVPAAASLAGLPTAMARRLLTDLADASLLAEHEPGRYAFHDLLRAFAAEQADASESASDQQRAIRRTLDHYLYSARPAGALIFADDLPLPALAPLADAAVCPEHTHNTLDAIAWFEAEHGVLVAATALAQARGLDDHAWQIPCTMTQYFRAVGRTRDWVRLDQVALAAATRLGDHNALGRVYFSMGTRCRITQAFDDAISYLGQSMSHFVAIDDQASQALVHLAISGVHISQRKVLQSADANADIRIALGHASQALAWCHASGDKTAEARALADLSNHYTALGELVTAKEYCSRALQLNLEIGHVTGQVDSLDTLGRIHLDLGQYDEAIEYFLHALRTCQAAGIPVRPPHILESLGDAYLASGDQAAARAAWQELIDYARRQQRLSEHSGPRHARVLSKLERTSVTQTRPARQPSSTGLSR